MDELDLYFNRNKSTGKYSVIFVVSEFDVPRIIFGTDASEFLRDEETTSLKNLLGKRAELLPNEIGLYSGILNVIVFRWNHPEDPEEWDLTVTMEEIKKLDFKYD